MNQTSKCHQIQGCHGLYIDAFRAFSEKTTDKNSTFILTHYHSDHYSGLQRGKNSYKGPALIHCTRVTASLLREIHGVDPQFIVAHDYGCTWMYEIPSTKGGFAKVTFYDANHCPGAAIIHVHLLNSDKHHIHTGDMRFNLEKFSQYPLICSAIEQRKVDLLYLDTTYSKPKHDFIAQDEAIKMISSEVKKLLSGNSKLVDEKKKNFFQPKTKKSKCDDGEGLDQKRTLVLLSCYSIGKEKVLWHSATESNQKVYVNKTKYKMLECIQQDNVDGNSTGVDVSCNIIKKCTTNPHESDIHVIQMGTAGTLHPFFKPNFEQCALYAHQLNKGYSKVVAFLPTGWAFSSKFNRDNAIASQNVPMNVIKELLPPRTAQKGCYGNDSSIEVEVRLIPYSEHSSFSELRSCVEFFKPRQIIPTVFSNEKDYSDIENRFRDLVDSQRAKAAFIRSIGGVNSSTMKHSGSKRPVSAIKHDDSQCDSRPNKHVVNNSKDISVGGENDSKHTNIEIDDEKVAMLVSMGFDVIRSRESLVKGKNSLEGAIQILLEQSN